MSDKRPALTFDSDAERTAWNRGYDAANALRDAALSDARDLVRAFAEHNQQLRAQCRRLLYGQVFLGLLVLWMAVRGLWR